MKTTKFLVIECGGKTQYRSLKHLKHHPNKKIRRWARSLRIYTAGARFSAYRRNPLALAGGIYIEENIARLLLCLEGSIPMEGSMLSLIGESLERLYRQCDDPYKNPPTMKDLLRVVKEVLDKKDYSPEVKSDLATAINNRLGILTRRTIGSVFNCSKSTPDIATLVNSNSIIELSILTPRDQALLTLELLTAVGSYIKNSPHSGKDPRLMILLEEAATVIGASTDAQASDTNADPKAFTSDIVAAKMLAQLRAEGVGVVILNQLPGSIAPEVIKNVKTRMAFGMEEADEREMIGGAMLFGDIETADIANLSPGQCYFKSEGYFAPRKLQVPNIIDKLNIHDTAKGDGIVELIKDDKWFIDDMNTILAYESAQLSRDMDIFNDRLRGFIDRVSLLISPAKSVKALEKIKKMRILRRDILDSFDDFLGDSFLPLTRTEIPKTADLDHLAGKRADLIKDFKTTVKPAVNACIDTLEKYIKIADGKEI